MRLFAIFTNKLPLLTSLSPSNQGTNACIRNPTASYIAILARVEAARTGMATSSAEVATSLAPTTVTAEQRTRSVAGGVRVPEAEFEYDLAGESRSKTRFKGMDGVVFDVYDAAACVSGSMAAVIRSKDPAMPLDYAYPLSNVQSNVLETVLKYCYFHASTMRASISDDEAEQWDDEFAALDPRHLCELASAAYYLDIKALVDLTCKTIASMISGKSVDEIRSTFHIENDLDSDFLNVLTSDWHAPGNHLRAARYHSRMFGRKRSKQKGMREEECVPVENEPIATASVEEIMNYIDGDAGKRGNTKSGAKKRRKRKKRVEDTPVDSQTSDPKSSDDNQAESSETKRSVTGGRSGAEGADENERVEGQDHDTSSSGVAGTSAAAPRWPSSKSEESHKCSATGSAASTSSSTWGELVGTSKRARQRARKRERKRAAAAAGAGAADGGSGEESGRESPGANKFADEFDEEALHHMDEEVEAFARRLVANDCEAQAMRRGTLKKQLRELELRAAYLNSQIARLTKERGAVEEQMRRVHGELVGGVEC